MSIPSPAFEPFIKSYPGYLQTGSIDRLRETDYARLDQLEHIYLDYTGGGIYADSQLRLHQKLLAENVFGNPHSSNPTSQAATRLVEGTREAILRFFNAEPVSASHSATANAN